MGPKLDIAGAGDQPPHPADRRDQLGDRVLGGDRILQDGGVQHPPTPPLEHPGLLHDLSDRLEDPPRPIRRSQTSPPVHQHGRVEPLVVQPQPAGDLPGDIAPQRTDRLPVRQALQGLQHHHRGDHLGGHRRVPATLAGNISKQLGWEQLMAMVGEKAIHRPLGDQVTAPGRRVQLVIEGVVCRAHAGQSPRSRPPARTTGSTRPTGSAEPRPFSRLLVRLMRSMGQPVKVVVRVPGLDRRGDLPHLIYWASILCRISRCR